MYENFANLYESFGNEAFVCLSSEYDMIKKEHFHIGQDFCQWKIQPFALKKKVVIREVSGGNLKMKFIYLFNLKLFCMLINKLIS